MKIQKIFLFLFVLFIPISYGLTFTNEETVFVDYFNGSIPKGDWTLKQETCNPFPAPIVNYTTSTGVFENGLGNNKTYSCSATLNFWRQGDYFEETSTNILILRYSLIDANTPDTLNRFIIRGGSANYSGVAGSGLDEFTIIHNTQLDNLTTVTDSIRGDVCQSTYQGDNQTHDYIFFIDMDEDIFYLLEDDEVICSGISLYNYPNISHFRVSVGSNIGQTGLRIIDNIMYSYADSYDITGSISNECTFPTIFCDNFNYATPMSSEGWQVYTGSFSIDPSFSPINDKLTLNSTSYHAPYHETDAFPVDYPTEEGLRTVESIYSPVFSIQYKLNVSTTTEQDGESFMYNVRSRDSKTVLRFKTVNNANNISWYYWDDESDTLSYTILCDNCSTLNKEHDIKISVYFSDSEYYDFNSSLSTRYIDFFIDGVKKNGSIPFLDNSSLSLGQYQFLKTSDYNFEVDDYYVYVGTDPNTDTSSSYYTELYTPKVTNTSIGTGTGDLSSNIDSIWSQFGINSLASRVIVGLVLILITFIAVASAMASIHASGSGVVITALISSFVMMILLTITGLLPYWIPVLLGVMGGGIGAFFVAKSMQGG